MFLQNPLRKVALSISAPGCYTSSPIQQGLPEISRVTQSLVRHWSSAKPDILRSTLGGRRLYDSSKARNAIILRPHWCSTSPIGPGYGEKRSFQELSTRD